MGEITAEAAGLNLLKTMSKRDLIFLAVVFVGAIGSGLLLSKVRSKDPELRSTAGTGKLNDSVALGERSDAGEGAVTVTAKIADKHDGVVVFDFFLNTHSVNLTDFDIQDNVVLISGRNTFKPTEWVENGGSGHHRNGKLVFTAPVQGEIELVVFNLAGIRERKLTWEL